MQTTSKKAQLLRAARDEFAQYGARGARIDGILAAANVNKRHLYEIFGTKEELYLSVLSDVSREIEADFAAAVWPGDAGGCCETYAGLLTARGDFAVLRHWETLSPTIHGPRIQKTADDLRIALENKIAAALGRSRDDELLANAFENLRILCELFTMSLALMTQKRRFSDEYARPNDCKNGGESRDLQRVCGRILSDMRNCFEKIPF